ncbi:DDE_3 domain-containing protein [Trichonephila clavipes]|nr:DDE_3 domain-containing protein [Trichonephila clavipes]
MVWGAIAYDSQSTLIVMHGTLTVQCYVDDILQPHAGPFLNGLQGAIFQQDNARPHTAKAAQDFLRHFQTLPWPTRSPDLSPVEHVWDQLKRQMPSCCSVHDLELAVQDLWAHLPQDNIRYLINSMPDRVVACIAAGGVVQRAIEVAHYLCRCTPCIRLIFLFFRSSESLICVIICIKFPFNPMLSSWVAIFNVPECIIRLQGEVYKYKRRCEINENSLQSRIMFVNHQIFKVPYCVRVSGLKNPDAILEHESDRPKE